MGVGVVVVVVAVVMMNGKEERTRREINGTGSGLSSQRAGVDGCEDADEVV